MKGLLVPSTISIPQLRAALNGRVITPDAAAYDHARAVFYGGFDQRPAAIVRVADGTDVARVVELTRETGLELAVRSGSHSNAGHSVSDGGIVLDLGEMRSLDIHVEGRTAWAQTGLTAGAYTPPPPRMAWRPGSATPPRSGSAGSPSAAAWASWSASTASRSTTCWPPRS